MMALRSSFPRHSRHCRDSSAWAPRSSLVHAHRCSRFRGLAVTCVCVCAFAAVARSRCTEPRPGPWGAGSRVAAVVGLASRDLCSFRIRVRCSARCFAHRSGGRPPFALLVSSTGASQPTLTQICGARSSRPAAIACPRRELRSLIHRARSSRCFGQRSAARPRPFHCTYSGHPASMHRCGFAISRVYRVGIGSAPLGGAADRFRCCCRGSAPRRVLLPKVSCACWRGAALWAHVGSLRARIAMRAVTAHVRFSHLRSCVHCRSRDVLVGSCVRSILGNAPLRSFG